MKVNGKDKLVIAIGSIGASIALLAYRAIKNRAASSMKKKLATTDVETNNMDSTTSITSPSCNNDNSPTEMNTAENKGCYGSTLCANECSYPIASDNEHEIDEYLNDDDDYYDDLYENKDDKEENINISKPIDVVCPNCNGTGEMICDWCHGECLEDCYFCRNTVKVDCTDCNGRGWIYCPDCSSGKVSCPSCGGNPDDDGCGSCGGLGEIECETCNGRQHIDCESCDGEGTQDCEHCKDRRDCWKCDSTGKVSCSECDGTGRVTVNK